MNTPEEGENSPEIPIFSLKNAPKSEIFGHKSPETDQKPPETEEKPEKLIDLEAIEVDNELASLYSSAKCLLEEVIIDPGTPANQKAQVMNSVLAMIEKISKTRTDLYNAERIRRLEQTLIKTLREFPRELQEKFMEAYEKNLRSGS